MSELKQENNLHAHILFDVVEKQNSPLVTTLLMKSGATSVHVDTRRGVIEAIIQATDREKLGEIANNVLTTAERMSAGFRGILINGTGGSRTEPHSLRRESGYPAVCTHQHRSLTG